jgi:acyl-CoA thioester hydrolase
MTPPTAGEFRDGAHWLWVRVYYEDTDFTGVVYHANYLRFMERGRSDFLRLAGVDHVQLEAEEGGTAFAIARVEIDFKKPARIDDALTVRTQFSPLSGVRLRGHQQVLRGDELLAEAMVTAVCIGPDGRARKPPATMAQRLAPWCVPVRNP